jgi:hypothetical protein
LAEIAIKRPSVAVQPLLRKPRRGDKSGGQGGTLIMAAAGTLFLSYVFNFHGFQDSTDEFFHGLDVAARAQTPSVAHLYLAVLPYAGAALALGFLWILTRTLLRMISGAFTPKKKNAVPAPEELPLPEMCAARLSHPGVKSAGARPSQKAAAVCVKPLRLDMRDVGVAKVILPRR